MVRRLFTRAYIAFRMLLLDPDERADIAASIDRVGRPLFVVLAIATTCIVIVLIIDLAFGLDADSKLGIFGDFFGGVLNPLFTFLTVFGLIITIVIQRTDLRLAREEYAKTASALATQAIESTFFSTVSLHHKIIEGLRFDPGTLEATLLDEIRRHAGIPQPMDPVVVGRQVFDTLIKELKKRALTPADVKVEYQKVQDNHNHILGHYFRNLYQALKLIDGYGESDLSDEQKRKYASILRAQLSSSELVTLFINCTGTTVDEGQFRNLLIRYHMLEHLPLKKVDGSYVAGREELPVADEDSILEYLTPRSVPADSQRRLRGAFGRNPVVLPNDASD
jgi:hypothetical protein